MKSPDLYKRFRRIVSEYLICLIAGIIFLFSNEACAQNSAQTKTKLGISGSKFTINGKPEFLYGISYYGALGAAKSAINRDLRDIKKFKFNWIRIWANWTGFEMDISAVDGKGNPRKEFLDKLEWIVIQCNHKGIIIDVTLTHGDGLASFEAHEQAVKTIVNKLRNYNNWYLDLANERNIGDSRFVSFGDIKRLANIAKKLYPNLLITASAGNDISNKDLKQYLEITDLDFISPHRPRNEASSLQTETKTHKYLEWMKQMGRMVPIHYQEPFRRGYTQWQPKAEDYAADLTGARNGGAAGWCFHNGDERDGKDHMPRRSFDMHKYRLFDQLDQEELKAIKILADH